MTNHNSHRHIDIMPHKLILLRHGQSQFNDQNLFCGWMDVSLTDKGRTQAKRAADLLGSQGIYPDCIFTSILDRSQQTAEIIIKELELKNVDIHKTWRLNERHYGKLQGQKKNEVLEKVGKEQYMYWRRAYHGVPPLIDDVEEIWNNPKYKNVFASKDEIPRGESLKMVVDRLNPLIHGEIKRNLIDDNKTVLVCGHGSTCRAMLKLVKGLSNEEIKKVNIPNSMPLILEVDDNMKLVKNEYYLDPEEARIKSNLVAEEGFSKL